MVDTDKARNSENEAHTSACHSIYWLKATIFQGRRILDTAPDGNTAGYSSVFNSPSWMDEMFFLVAARKAYRWIDKMDLLASDTNRFFKLTQEIKDVRDRREHDDERYGVGINKNWENPLVKSKSTGPVVFYGTASVTDYSGGRCLLGGIVDVAEVVSAAEDLLPPLLKKDLDFWTRRLRSKRWTEDFPALVKRYCIEPRF